MLLKRWQDLPDSMKNDLVKKYYDYLYLKRYSILAKRFFDVTFAIILLIILSPVILIISIAIKINTKGPVVFRQIRITQYGKEFKIIKFCTMVRNSDKVLQVTTSNDDRITGIGRLLRKYRLDEIPQLLNIITGDMSFVGTRPEVPRFVEKYTAEMMATLLLPAGVTSEASILYKDEEQLLTSAVNADKTYMEEVLPGKMQYNLRSLEKYSFSGDLKTMLKTITAVFIKNKAHSYIKSENGGASTLRG